MKPNVDETPTQYQQPDENTGFRDLDTVTDSTLEHVNYVSESHIRFWYNVQAENYALHHHDAMEVIICMENPYTVSIMDTKYKLNEGDMLFIPPHLKHELICDSVGVRFICMMDIEMLKEFHDFQLMEPVFQKPFFCNQESCPDIYQRIYTLFMKMIDIYFSDNFLWETRIYSIIIEVLSRINDFYLKSQTHITLDPSSYMVRARYGRISSALYFIDTNFTNDITLEDAANYIGFSKYHFSRLFKKYTNSTFYDYLCRRRIQKAQSLLETSASITDIAFQVGFNNITTFSRCFKKYAGCSPSEFRKNCTEK